MHSFLLVPIILFAQQANACSVCGFGDDGSRWAYLFTTGLLTLIPLLGLGGLVYYIYKESKKRSGETL